MTKTEKILMKTFPTYNFLNFYEYYENSGHKKEILKVLKEFDKVFTLLRRVYNIVEEEHLNDNKLMITNFINRSLVNDIFNYLSSKDKKFNEIFIKRQKRFRRRAKQNTKKLKEMDERKLYEELKKKFEGK